MVTVADDFGKLSWFKSLTLAAKDSLNAVMPAAVQRQFPQQTRNSPPIHDAQYILKWFFLFRCHPFNTFHYPTGYVFTVQGDLMPTIHILRNLPANILPISNQSTSSESNHITHFAHSKT
ncbi:hypothetical protein FRC03_002139 [Tulasnella sp. 419]|nr:hypothetical protein FRC03_002139 [Tulasnella sp. 419]